MKARSLTPELHSKPAGLNLAEEGRIPGVGVKSVDIRRNTNGEGSLLGLD